MSMEDWEELRLVSRLRQALDAARDAVEAVGSDRYVVTLRALLDAQKIAGRHYQEVVVRIETDAGAVPSESG